MASDILCRLRALAVPGRVTHLPTVWSNCLAGWWLGGGENFAKLPFLFAGASFLYSGGMLLNDAFDAEFDRNYRKERAVSAGVVALRTLWKWGFALVAIGTVSLFFIGTMPGMLGLALALGMVAYAAMLKLFTFSPVLMGLGRLLFYVAAATAGVDGIGGGVIWCGLALAAYVAAVEYLARQANAHTPVQHWRAYLLGTPIVLAILINAGPYREPALLLSLVLGLWIIRCLRSTFWSGSINIIRTVSGLQAGIVLVDMLAVAPAPHEFGFVFLILFGLAIMLQKWIPAA